MTKIQFKLSQIVLALVVAFGAMAFSACGADTSKAPMIEWRSMGSSLRISLKSQDDTTIITKIVMSGRDGVCEMGEFFGAGEDSNLLYGERITFGSVRGFSTNMNKCSPKNGQYEVKLTTNLGEFEYKLKVIK